MKRYCILVLATALAAVAVAQTGTSDAARQLKAAVNEELVNGDLNSAIKQYAAIAAKYAKTDRPTAAMALVHEAEAYQKLGDAESKRIFSQVLKDYADQKDAVALAEAQVGGSSAAEPIRRLVCSDCRGVLSPDGASLLSNGGLGVGFQMLDLSTHQAKVLVEPVAGMVLMDPIFSSDGSRIAYEFGPNGNDNYSNVTIEVVNSDGSGHRTVYRGAWALAWSPDGKRLLAERTPAGKPTYVNSLLWIDIATGTAQELPTEHPNIDAVKVSPDGRYVAFNASKDENAEENVYLIASDGSGEAVLAPSAAYQEPVGWTPDGKYLIYGEYGRTSTRLWAQVFADGRPQGEPVDLHTELDKSAQIQSLSRSGVIYSETADGPPAQLDIAPFDFTAGKIVAPPSVVWSAAQEYIPAQYDWSPDGKSLAYTALDGSLGRSRPAILIRSMETGVTRIVPSDGMSLEAAMPRWAPDSRTVLVGGFNEIHLIDTQTDAISTLKADGLPLQGLIFQTRWSPDGKKIYFAAHDKNGNPAFWESDPDLKNLRQVIVNVAGGLNLTRDGRTIITPVKGVQMIVPVSGGEPKPLHSDIQGGVGNIFLSPDGKYVGLVNAVPSSTLKRTSAWIVPAAGGDMREALKVDPPLSIAMGMWAQDSKSIFLRTLDAEGQQVAMWRVPVDGGQAVKVDTGLNLDQYTQFAIPSPAGNWIAFVRGVAAPSTKMWVLENYLPHASN